MRYSQRLVREAEKYALTYMKTTKYIAVMIRVEKIRQKHNVTDCFHLTLEEWRTMVNDTGINIAHSWPLTWANTAVTASSTSRIISKASFKTSLWAFMAKR